MMALAAFFNDYAAKIPILYEQANALMAEPFPVD